MWADCALAFGKFHENGYENICELYPYNFSGGEFYWGGCDYTCDLAYPKGDSFGGNLYYTGSW